jgi:UDP-2,3-diacylglucosamine pyrophosphatase LpxH
MTHISKTGLPPRYRSVFISDTHLGTRGCRSDFLANFLSRTTCHHLYLVGDIIDGWRLRKSAGSAIPIGRFRRG